MLELFLVIFGAVLVAIWVCAMVCTLIMTQELLGLTSCIMESPKALLKYLLKGPVGAMDLWWVGQRVEAIKIADAVKMQELADIKAAQQNTVRQYNGDSGTKSATHLLPHTYYN